MTLDLILIVIGFIVLSIVFTPVYLFFKILWTMIKLSYHSIRLALIGTVKTAKYVSRKIDDGATKEPELHPTPNQE